MKSVFKRTTSRISVLLIGVAIGFTLNNFSIIKKSLYAAKYEKMTYRESGIEDYELPISSFKIDKDSYVGLYDPVTKNPKWVLEKISSNSLNGRVKRDGFQFKEDPKIPEVFRSTLQDYSKKGFDRGHLACAANHVSSTESMSDTFYLSNICPQYPTMNRGYWSKLEKYVRDLTSSYVNINVITGPLYIPEMDSDGNKYVRYQVIGKNDVAVPTHFFKVLRKVSLEGTIEMEAYIIPNRAVLPAKNLDTFKTTVEAVEKAAGILF